MEARGLVWLPAGVDNAGNTNRWEPAEVLQQGTATSLCNTQNGERVEVPLSKLEMREVLPDRGVDDLTALSYLHEPAILDNLHTRFSTLGPSKTKLIYTYCGHICIAVNPFERLKNLYTVAMMQKFRGSLHEENEPHIYAAVETAFSSMITGVKDGVGNQSILVSGESGAGKTESVKIMMEYLAQAAGRRRPHSGEEGRPSMMSDVAYAVMKSNPLLEAFGNARTLRNDNSSRFGKFTRILFDNGGTIVGSRIDVYLLEKSRVVHQTAGERSFHVFYQLLRASSRHIPEDFRRELGLRAVEEQNYLSSSGCTSIDNVDDEAEYQGLIEAMDAVGLNEAEKNSVVRIVAAVLMLGHIAFEETFGISGDMQAAVSGGMFSLSSHANLLGCVVEDLATALVSRQICARDEWYTIQLTKDQAESSREGLAKALYERLFIWLVERINISTTPHNASRVKSTIGILDIFGFESFENNNFEQLLINFANEKLQQQFTWYVFKLEQEEYNREGIEWTSVDFQDNQPVLDTIEGFGGVIPLLDEESHLQRGCDESFVLKLRKTRVRRVAPLPGAKLEAILSFPRMKETNFVIRHYAGFVEYCTSGFRQKNKDALHPDMVTIVRSSSNSFVKNLFSERPNGGQMSRGRMPTLAAQFKVQLNDLVDEINQTAVHYVRCIKPNQHASKDEFDMVGVHEQLRCQGILEAIRIARAAYPNRLNHVDIVARYTLCLSDAKLAKDNSRSDTSVVVAISTICDKRQQSEMLMKALNLDSSLYQIGTTRVFFKRAAMEELEASRGRVIDRKLTVLQAAVRAWSGKRTYRDLKLATIALQARIRRFIAQNNFKATVYALIRIQSACRLLVARKTMRRLRSEMAATLIQRQARRRACNGHYLKLRQKAMVCQKHARRALAMRSYISMRNEAREDAKLVNIVAKLQDRLQEENQSAVHIKQLEEKVQCLEAYLSQSHCELAQTKDALKQQGRQLLKQRSERSSCDSATDSQLLFHDVPQCVATLTTDSKVVTDIRAELQLRIDAQDAELQAARVAQIQSSEIICRLEQMVSSLQQSYETEKRGMYRDLGSSIAECFSMDCDGDKNSSILRGLQRQLTAHKSESAIAKSTAAKASEALTRYQGQLLNVMAGHEDRTDLCREIDLMRKQSRTQCAELKGLRAEYTDIAAKLASANAHLRLTHHMAPQTANDCVESAISDLRHNMEQLCQRYEHQVMASQRLADAASAKYSRSEQLTKTRIMQLNTTLMRQQIELDRLRQDQQDTHVELARSADEYAVRPAVSRSQKGTPNSIVLQREQQILVAETELKAALSRPKFAETQVDNHLQTLEADQLNRLVAIDNKNTTEQATEKVDALDGEEEPAPLIHSALASAEPQPEPAPSPAAAPAPARGVDATTGARAQKPASHFSSLQLTSTLRETTAAKPLEHLGNNVNAANCAALEERICTLEHQLSEAHHTINAQRLELANAVKLATVPEVANSAAQSQETPQTISDPRVHSLQSQLHAALQTNAVLRDQVSTDAHHQNFCMEPTEQFKRQQQELQQLRLEKPEAGKHLACTLAELSATTLISSSPSAAGETMTKAKHVAKPAAADHIVGFKRQLENMQVELQAKDTALNVLLASKYAHGETVENDTTRYIKTDSVSSSHTTPDQSGGVTFMSRDALVVQLQVTQADLQSQRQENVSLRGRLEKLSKNKDDLQLMAMASPLRGDRKKNADELSRARSTIEDKNSQLTAAAKKQLLADRKQAQLATKTKSCESALQNAKVQVRKFVEDAMALTQDVKRIEEILGFPSSSSRQTSRDLHKRLVTLAAKIKCNAAIDQQMAAKSRQLLTLRKKLQNANQDELCKKYRGEDQKELLRMSNSICAAIRTQAAATRNDMCALYNLLEDDNDAKMGQHDATNLQDGWNVRLHIRERAELVLAFVDALVDESNLHCRINEHMHHVLAQNGDSARTLPSHTLDPFRSQVPRDGIEALVSRIYSELADGKTRDDRSIGLPGYVRRCFDSCDGQRDLSRMHKQLVSTLEMMEAANKLSTLEWETDDCLGLMS